MSRPSLPSIPPSALRDEVDPALVDRVWERLDRDLPLVRAAAPRAGSRLALTAAAAAFAFCAGAVVGTCHGRAPAPLQATSAPPAEATARASVFAAGRSSQSYSLPGGGTVMLAPNSVVEVGRESPRALELELLAGEASFDAVERHQSSLVVAVEGARLAAHGSKLRVARAGDTMGVLVLQGTAEVTSSEGTRVLVREGELERSFPIRTVHALAPAPAPKHVPQPVQAEPTEVDGGVASEPAPIVATPATPAKAAWLALATREKPDYAGALRLLEDQPGGVDAAIANARSAYELMALRLVLGKIDARVLRCLTRIVDEFPSDERAGIAAGELARYYEVQNKPDLAKKYRDFQAKSKVPEVAAAALCQSMKSDLAAGKKTEAAELAKQYTSKYPDGPCKEEAERIAAGQADDEADEDPPEESKGDSPKHD